MGRLLNIVTPFDQMAKSANAHEAVRATRFTLRTCAAGGRGRYRLLYG